MFFATLSAMGVEEFEVSWVAWAYVLSQTLVAALAYAATAIAWHRFVLLGRRPAIVQFPLRTLGYVALLIVPYIVVWLIPFVAASLAIPHFSYEQPQALAPLLIAFVLFAVFMCLSLKLPAFAIADRKMTFAESWRRTRPLWPELVWGTIVACAPALILMQAVWATLFDLFFGDLLAMTFLRAVASAIFLAGILLFATFLSLSYRFVVGDDDVGNVFD